MSLIRDGIHLVQPGEIDPCEGARLIIAEIGAVFFVPADCRVIAMGGVGATCDVKSTAHADIGSISMLYARDWHHVQAMGTEDCPRIYALPAHLASALGIEVAP